MQGHLGTAMHKRGSEQKSRCIMTDHSWEAARTEFRTQETIIERAEMVKYLVWIVLSDNSDWTEVSGNLMKAHRKWGGSPA